MKVERVHDRIRYTLSNEDLKEGDVVYPIARGRQTEKDGWILHNIDFRDFMSGFPDDPHVIHSIKIDNLKEGASYREVMVYTDHGYGHYETYYKVIKKEHQVLEDNECFSRLIWVEIE